VGAEPEKVVPTEFRFRCLGGSDSVTPGPNPKRLLLVIGAVLTLCVSLAVSVVPAGMIRVHRDEASAIGSLRAIVRAEYEYKSAHPREGYACTLQALGGNPKLGPATSAAAQLLPASLSNGVRDGYFFDVRGCTRTRMDGADLITGFRAVAVPIAIGKSGRRGFCADQTGAPPRVDPNGGDHCSEEIAQ
jgi:type IV pilus assembly protein PilA